MSHDDHNKSQPESNSPRLGGKTIGSMALVAIVALYSFARPVLNDSLGLNLPAIASSSDSGTVADGKPKSEQQSASTTESAAKPKKPGDRSKAKKSGENQDRTSESNPSKQTSGPLADRIQPNESPKESASPTKSGSDLKYGLLKHLGNERYMSPSGLEYTKGSAEGHRLEHLRRHVADQPNRPGKHGVFDGGMEGALKTIDSAYEKAKKNQRTTKQVDRGRTIYTTDMGKRVGFIGGREGKQKRNPMARRVRLVLEGTRVITAYPL